MDSNIVNNIIGVKGVACLFKEKEKRGIAKITRFYWDSKDLFNVMDNFRSVRDNGRLFYMYEGHYCKLSVDGELMMSDTAMERKTNFSFINNANGRVLIAGLGLGLIIHNILDKDNVSEILVIEKHKDVISLVKPKFKHPKLKIVCADIFKWEPNSNDLFDTIYFDIWAAISGKHISQIKALHNKFKPFLNCKNPSAFMDSWMKKEVQKLSRL